MPNPPIPKIPARRRGKPWVKSTIRVTRELWRNWSGELSSAPRRLYCDEAGGPWRSPRTLEDLQRIVQDARAEGVTVRAFGSSHSWSKLVPNDAGYLVDNRMIGAEDGFYRMSLAPGSPDGARKARATAPPGVLSGELEAWLWEMGYTLPASAFEDVFTLGGMVATATHGTGFAQGTLSDMVVGMTFVDGLGQVRRWTRETCTPDELAAMQCGLGCLGLIYDITLEVEPRYEVLHQAKIVPYAELFADTDAARAALRDLHELHTSVEFFWWPMRFSGIPMLSKPEINPDLWVLTTKRQVPADARPRGALRRFVHLQLLDIGSMSFSGVIIRITRRFPQLAFLLPWVSGFTNLWVSLRSGAFRMPQYDANHFVNAGAVEFVLALAAEWSVPFRRHADVQRPDGYERVRRSFADLHDRVVEAFNTWPLTDARASPVILAVEMRTLAASTALLSPGYSLDPAVFIAAPEVVTTAAHPAWTAFAQRANLTMTNNPAVFGDCVRGHHGKPFHGFAHPKFPDGGMLAYQREQFRAAGTWDRFLAVREAIDPDGVFLNPHLRDWFYPPASS